MRFVVAFGRFWWDFVVGDDWTVAVGVLVSVGATAALTHAGHPAWFVLPVFVFVTLGASVYRVRAAHLKKRRTRPHGPRSPER
jgi:hypothetical protein